MTAQEIAEAVEAERKAAGMGIYEHSRRAGYTRAAFWRALSGKNVNFYTLQSFAEAVGLEIVVRKKEDSR